MSQWIRTDVEFHIPSMDLVLINPRDPAVQSIYAAIKEGAEKNNMAPLELMLHQVVEQHRPDLKGAIISRVESPFGGIIKIQVHHNSLPQVPWGVQPPCCFLKRCAVCARDIPFPSTEYQYCLVQVDTEQGIKEEVTCSVQCSQVLLSLAKSEQEEYARMREYVEEKMQGVASALDITALQWEEKGEIERNYNVTMYGVLPSVPVPEENGIYNATTLPKSEWIGDPPHDAQGIRCHQCFGKGKMGTLKCGVCYGTGRIV